MSADDRQALSNSPTGCRASETCHQFVLISGPAVDPLRSSRAWVQPGRPSRRSIPLRVAGGYRADLQASDRARLGAADGEALLWLALICPRPGQDPTVNLRAPLVINPRTLRGIQLITSESTYRSIIRCGRRNTCSFLRGSSTNPSSIGDGIEVTVLRVGRDSVRLGVKAARQMPVHRGEIYEAIRQANAARPPIPAR
jgi:carbon storage regulator CsrA